VAEDRAARERLATLREVIARDATQLRSRWHATRARVPQEWHQIRTFGRETVEILWLLLRRKGTPGSTPPSPPPS
jgi:hypothetical protein